MFKRFMSIIEEIGAKQRQRFEEKIQSFNDPIAKKVEWGPMSKMSSNITTRVMIRTAMGNIHVVPSLSNLIFSALFIAIGWYVMWISSIYRTPILFILSDPINSIQGYIQSFPELIESRRILGQAFGLIFVVIGAAQLISSLRPTSFKAAEKVYSTNFVNKQRTDFRDIHAIQLLLNSGGSANSSSSYELNLVLKNAERVHVIRQPRKKQILESAKKISELLSVPIWDMLR